MKRFLLTCIIVLFSLISCTVSEDKEDGGPVTCQDHLECEDGMLCVDGTCQEDDGSSAGNDFSGSENPDNDNTSSGGGDTGEDSSNPGGGNNSSSDEDGNSSGNSGNPDSDNEDPGDTGTGGDMPDSDITIDPNKDSDGDGIPDKKEIEFGGKEKGYDPHSKDTDMDGLKDGEEDANQNGIQDNGETSPAEKDTDHDGLTDYIEVNSAYRHEKDGDARKTDPTNPDTDGDGLKDGEEDLNKNGRLDFRRNESGKFIDVMGQEVTNSDGSDLDDPLDQPCKCPIETGENCTVPSESDPTRADSNCNTIEDGDETLSNVCSEEMLVKLDTHNSFETSSILALPSAQNSDTFYKGFDVYQDITDQSGTKVGALFFDSTHKVAGILFSTPKQTDATPVAHRTSDFEKMGLSFTNSNYRNFTTWDNYDAEYMIGIFDKANTSMKDMINSFAQKLIPEVDSSSLLQISDTTTDSKWHVVWETVYRNENNVVRLGVISGEQTASADSSTSVRLNDIAGGTALASGRAGQGTFCQTFVSGIAKADIIWVVDSSGSMAEEQYAIIEAAEIMSDLLTNSGIDWRIAVTSMDSNETSQVCMEFDNSGSGGDDGWGGTGPCKQYQELPANGAFVKEDRFTKDVEEFKEWVALGTSGSATEEGLHMAKKAVEKHHWDNASLNENQRIREDAQVIIVTLSDESPYYICESQSGCVKNQQKFDELANFFKGNNIPVFSISYRKQDEPIGFCKDSSGVQDEVYKEMSEFTGGMSGSICDEDQKPNMNNIMLAAIGKTTNYKILFTPISSSIRVAARANDGTITHIPKSRSEGFDFDGIENKILLFGKYTSGYKDFSVSYKFWTSTGNEE